MDIGFFIGLAIIIGIFVVPKLIEGYRESKLKEQIAWTTTQNNSWDSPRALELWQYIHNIQVEYELEEFCRISGNDEWNIAKSIIQECTDEIGKKYLDRRIEASKALSALSSEEFFFSSLYLFLWKHDYDSICSKPKYRDSFVTENEDGYPIRRHYLTAEGIVFYKLLYVTCLYCKQNQRINCIETGVWILHDTDEYYRKVLKSKIYDKSIK